MFIKILPFLSTLERRDALGLKIGG